MPFIIPLDVPYEPPALPPAIQVESQAVTHGARSTAQPDTQAPSTSPLADALARAYPGAEVRRVAHPVTRTVRTADGRTEHVAYTETAYVLVVPATAPVQQASAQPVDYLLKGNTLLITPEITYALRGLRTTDGEALARAVAGLYRAKGYLTVEAKVEGDTIVVVEGTSAVSGPYADYVAQATVLGEADMDGYKAVAMRRAVRAHIEMLALRINPRGMTRHGQAEVLVHGAPDPVAPVAKVAIPNQLSPVEVERQY